MNKDFANGLFAYKTTLAIVKSMIQQGIISEEEYLIIDTIMLKKYGLSSCSIFH